VVEAVGQRSARDRVRSGLGFLGYAALSDSTWISPFASPEVAGVLDAEGARFARFAARDEDPVARARQAWDLDALGSAYAGWLAFATKLVDDPPSVLDGSAARTDDERAFAVRSLLVHEWRKFLFTDPGLPAELLPADWPGQAAATFFAEQAARLLPAASRFVDDCLTDTGPDNHDQSGAHP
jgi:phenylacetic acid degradation operon negative regulatory protein